MIIIAAYPKETKTMMHTDTYYRGYRLATYTDGDVLIYSGPDHIETTTSQDHAKTLIDEWLNAR